MFVFSLTIINKFIGFSRTFVFPGWTDWKFVLRRLQKHRRRIEFITIPSFQQCPSFESLRGWLWQWTLAILTGQDWTGLLRFNTKKFEFKLGDVLRYRIFRNIAPRKTSFRDRMFLFGFLNGNFMFVLEKRARSIMQTFHFSILSSCKFMTLTSP